MDIVITLPKTVAWEDYQLELDAVKNGNVVMNFKVPSLPKKSTLGSRCYLVYNGFVRGWMEIVGFSSNGFYCSVTGTYWDGKFIQRSGEFHYIEHVPMKGFQGWRYFHINSQ